MSRCMRVSLRLSVDEYRQVKSMLQGRNISDFFRSLIKDAVEHERREANSFLELLKKIDASDLSKLVQKVDVLAGKIEAMKTGNTDERVLADLQNRLAKLEADVADIYEAVLFHMRLDRDVGKNEADSFARRRRDMRG